MISTMFILWFRLRKLYFYILLLTILIGGSLYVWFVDMPGGQFAHRFYIWDHTFSHALKFSPFFGSGIGSFARWAPMMNQGALNPAPLVWIWAHNEFLQVFFEMGIAGLVIIFCYIKGMFKGFAQTIKGNTTVALFGCFLAILLVSSFHFNFHLGKTAPVCIFLMALFHLKTLEAK